MIVRRVRWLLIALGSTAALASIVASAALGISLLRTGLQPHPVYEYTPPKGATLAVGSLAPDFKARDLDGEVFQLSAYRGQTVLLKIWSVACGDCTVSVPRDQEIYQALNDRAVLITVAVQSSEESVRKLAAEHQTRYPMLLDPDDAFMTLYNVRVTPTVYLIDPRGVIQAVLPTLFDTEQIDYVLRRCGPACKPTVR